MIPCPRHSASPIAHSLMRSILLPIRSTASLRPGDLVERADTFLIHACRHVSSVCAVILPAARRRLPNGKQRVKEYVHQLRRLERAIAQAKGRLYGQSRSVGLPWAGVWAQLCSEFKALMALEKRMISDLAVALGPRLGGGIASRLVSAEASSPTRPHPNSPHTGPLSGMARRCVDPRRLLLGRCRKPHHAQGHEFRLTSGSPNHDHACCGDAESQHQPGQRQGAATVGQRRGTRRLALISLRRSDGDGPDSPSTR